MSDDFGEIFPVWKDPVTLLPVHVMTELAVSISAAVAGRARRNSAVNIERSLVMMASLSVSEERGPRVPE